MPTDNRNRIKDVNEQNLHERFKTLTSSKNIGNNPINDIIEHPSNSSNEAGQHKDNVVEKDLSSLQNRFGVRKIDRPVKDAQLTARIDSRTLSRFKDIVKAMYYPDKPNINETVTQIIRAFVAEYDNGNRQESKDDSTGVEEQL